jgi:hypothetical protein
LLSCWSALAIAASDQRAYETILKLHRQSIVTVSYALSMDFMGSSQRAQGEVEGIVIEPGLILVPSNILNPGDQLRELMASDSNAGNIPNIKSSEFLVRLSGADEPLNARVLTQDRDLGLAWLVLDDAAKSPRGVSLASGRDPKVGETAYVLNQVSELFAYAPFVARVEIQGRIEIPYQAFVTNAAGKMLFDAKGRSLGYSVQRVSGNPSLIASGGFKAFGVLIPNSRLRELTERAVRTAPAPAAATEQPAASRD